MRNQYVHAHYGSRPNQPETLIRVLWLTESRKTDDAVITAQTGHTDIIEAKRLIVQLFDLAVSSS